ncbi:RagB/SusD family nutrient uptake outer membrane protein [Flavobacterium undicola]|uniref:RagB/SusD family nutrient uptake outer membrane protein n=1 Tax=Flavobacterium undicola TaxID=1932779 RepID=UPI0013768875|nr:RagB/SusD family nutrient uptake outer membrane protein [Flavobacterium undicola]MBA0882449.1 RagB/SusD family nutrient uptake outer membrane protein [Flavobacterium undicola]
MKTIKFKYLFIVIAMISLGSCSEDFVDITPKGSFLSDNYYADEAQATSALVGVYDIIRKNSGSFENMIAVMNAGSDDHYAGGGSATDGEGIQAFSKHRLTSINVLRPFWTDHYQGIFRANTLLLKLPNVAMSDNLKARFAAEAKALRAIYYFNLVRIFKNVPLLLDPLTATNMYNVEQAAPEAVYAQIEKDLLEAIAVLPTTVPVATDGGRLTKCAAQAMLGKVYLYDGKKAEAAAVLAQVNGTPRQANQYGNKLLPNYNDLWVFSNKFNAESLLEVSHTNASNADWWFWGSGMDEGNTLNVMVGVRNYSRTSGSTAADLAPGWSFDVITQDLYDAIKTDPRFGATVFDMKAIKAAGQADYVAGYQDTGYFLNKFMPRNSDKTTGGGAVEINYQQNSYIIRLADTYLMEAEALGSGARAQALLDAVRARVGLPSVPVTLAAIKNERRLELAGEGHRFFDLVRWGDAATKLADRGFVSGKDEIWPIPTSELQGTKLKQNPGYN